MEEAVDAHFDQVLQGMLQPWSMDVQGNLTPSTVLASVTLSELQQPALA